jgi:hypothetical protein
MTPKTTREVLIAARALLVRDGWVPLDNWGPTDACPPWDALKRASDFSSEGSRASWHEAIRILERFTSGDVVDWSAAQTSVEPVLAAFDRAIEACRE